jgi:hypothetical protein
VIHEHEALPLASATLDFDLSPEALAELRSALADCPVCAERAANYREQQRLITRLPVIDVSEATRRRVTAAAISGRTTKHSPMLLLAAAALLGLLLAMAAAAGAFRKTQPIDLHAAEATPAAAPSAAASAVIAILSPSPGRTEPAGAGADRRIPPDSIAKVSTPNLRVRSQPRVAADSIKLEPLLQPGVRLFVIEGPVRADRYDWYRVVPIGSNPGDADSPLPSGWVAAADHDGEAWIERSEPNCPSQPVDVAALTAMHSLDRLACFGDTSLRFQAVVFGGIQSGWHAVPRSVDDRGELMEGPELALAAGGTVTPSDLPHGAVVLLEGSFDRADETDCVGGSEDPAIALVGCRSLFVVTRATRQRPDVATDAAAITVSSDVRVRSKPAVADDSIRLELLKTGTRLFVVDGPAIGSGYIWYQVAVPSIRTKADQARVGWVAIGSRQGERWVTGEDFDCPPPDQLTFDRFRVLSSSPVFHGGLTCFGSRSANGQSELSVVGRVRLECPASRSGEASSWLMTPAWVIVLTEGGKEARAILPFEQQALQCGEPTSSLIYAVTGHFDDSAAADCRAIGLGREPTAAENAAASYECRTKFVANGFYVVGPGPTPFPAGP